MSRRGWNPCQICSAVTNKPKGHVCDECVRKVRAYDRMQTESAIGMAKIARPWALHAVSTYPFGREREEAERHMAALLMAFPKYEKAHGELPLVDPTHSKTQARMGLRLHEYSGNSVVPASAAQLLADLPQVIYRCVQAAHRTGKAEGTDLLAQLAAGELTSADFEERAGIRSGRHGK